jgi:hypothetical protein
LGKSTRFWIYKPGQAIFFRFERKKSQRVFETLNAFTGETPSDPFRKLFRFSAPSRPKGETTPNPVTRNVPHPVENTLPVWVRNGSEAV